MRSFPKQKKKKSLKTSFKEVSKNPWKLILKTDPKSHFRKLKTAMVFILETVCQNENALLSKGIFFVKSEPKGPIQLKTPFKMCKSLKNVRKMILWKCMNLLPSYLSPNWKRAAETTSTAAIFLNSKYTFKPWWELSLLYILILKPLWTQCFFLILSLFLFKHFPLQLAYIFQWSQQQSLSTTITYD